MTQYFVNLDICPKITDPFTVWNAFDRTQTLFMCPDIKEVIPMGALISTKSFSDLCDDRAKELAGIAKGRKIYVLWSGGIDSTLVLAALRKQIDHKQLTVVYSGKSVEEYLWMFENWVHGKLNTVRFSNRTEDTVLLGECAKDGILCTGEIADQLFGSTLFSRYKDLNVLLKNWRYAWHFTNSNFIDRLEHFVSLCPQKINTVKDFLWWYNYAVKYQGVCFRMIINSPGVVLDKNLFHFFHTEAFNDWAVSTPTEEKFYGSDIKQYKMLAKNYIYAETKDSDYRDHKTKIVSAGFGLLMEKNIHRRISVNWIWS
jgi:hypothetical protein